MRPRRLVLLALAAVVFAVLPARAGAYGWPIRPFEKQHPIRGNFGDPRTIFGLAINADPWNGPGEFAFHNGVDISAPADTPVYPVMSGIARPAGNAEAIVESETPSGEKRIFQYDHIRLNVTDGETVVARRTILGWVQASALHVHLTEIDGFRVTNPLLKGHLAPYRDRTKPRVTAIDVRDAKGATTGALGVCGTISLAAEAYDVPSMAVPAPWNGLPVSPALITWKVTKLTGGTLIPTTYAADFRFTIPPNPEFWNVYAKGTYQNAPRFGLQQFGRMPGRFLYTLTPSLDTRTLGNGVVVVTVIAKDLRNNNGVLTRRLSIFNRQTPTGCPPEPSPARKP